MEDILNKVLSNDEIAKKSRGLKKQGKIIVMANGSFDLLHIGHIDLLRQAKRKGDILIIAINSDLSIRTYKGNDRPIIPEKERALMLASLFFVDHVTIFNESKALNIIEKIKPDILVKGIRPDPERLEEEKELVNLFGGKIEYVKESISRSTSDIIEDIRGQKSRSEDDRIYDKMPEVSIKILSNDEIAKKSRGLKKQGKKVIMVNGVFDMLHIGHIGFLRKAKEKGDVLFVAVNSNQSVKSYKGENKPIIPEKERVLMLASLFFVDHVTIFNESKALNIIEKIKPDILVKGIRPDPERLEEEKELVSIHGWKIQQIIHNVTTSSGQIIDKIRGVSSEGINNSQ